MPICAQPTPLDKRHRIWESAIVSHKMVFALLTPENQHLEMAHVLQKPMFALLRCQQMSVNTLLCDTLGWLTIARSEFPSGSYRARQPPKAGNIIEFFKGRPRRFDNFTYTFHPDPPFCVFLFNPCFLGVIFSLRKKHGFSGLKNMGFELSLGLDGCIQAFFGPNILAFTVSQSP